MIRIAESERFVFLPFEKAKMKRKFEGKQRVAVNVSWSQLRVGGKSENDRLAVAAYQN